jgi:uncharacterized membrane protein YoaK (UPF0700 family)
VEAVLLLAFVGGFVDAAGYLRLQGVFTTSITGNLVVATSSVASLRGVLCRSLVCVSFFAAGAVAAALSLRLRLAHGVSQNLVCFGMYGVEVAFIVASWAIGHSYDSLLLANKDIDHPINILLGCLLGASMGFHNVAAKEAVVNCPPTTVMTSTLINVAQNLSNAIGFLLAKHSWLRLDLGEACLTEEQKVRMAAKFDDSLGKLATTSKPLVSFIAGCIIGAVTMDKASWHCSIIPITFVLALMVDMFLRDRAAIGEQVAAKASAPQMDSSGEPVGEPTTPPCEVPSASGVALELLPVSAGVSRC